MQLDARPHWPVCLPRAAVLCGSSTQPAILGATDSGTNRGGRGDPPDQAHPGLPVLRPEGIHRHDNHDAQAFRGPTPIPDHWVSPTKTRNLDIGREFVSFGRLLTAYATPPQYRVTSDQYPEPARPFSDPIWAHIRDIHNSTADLCRFSPAWGPSNAARCPQGLVVGKNVTQTQRPGLCRVNPGGGSCPVGCAGCWGARTIVSCTQAGFYKDAEFPPRLHEPPLVAPQRDQSSSARHQLNHHGFVSAAVSCPAASRSPRAVLTCPALEHHHPRPVRPCGAPLPFT